MFESEQLWMVCHLINYLEWQALTTVLLLSLLPDQITVTCIEDYRYLSGTGSSSCYGIGVNHHSHVASNKQALYTESQ